MFYYVPDTAQLNMCYISLIQFLLCHFPPCNQMRKPRHREITQLVRNGSPSESCLPEFMLAPSQPIN